MTMLRLSFRELEGVSVWYCEGVYFVLLARGTGPGGMLPQRKFAFLSFLRCYLWPFLDLYNRFLNPSLQLHMHAICLGLEGGGEATSYR